MHIIVAEETTEYDEMGLERLSEMLFSIRRNQSLSARLSTLFREGRGSHTGTDVRRSCREKPRAKVLAGLDMAQVSGRLPPSLTT